MENSLIELLELSNNELEGNPAFIQTFLRSLLLFNNKVFGGGVAPYDLELDAKAMRNLMLDRKQQKVIEDHVWSNYDEYKVKLEKNKGIKLEPKDKDHAYNLATLDSVGEVVQFFKPYLEGYKKGVVIIGSELVDGQCINDLECLSLEEKEQLKSIIGKLKSVDDKEIARLHAKYAKNAPPIPEATQ